MVALYFIIKCSTGVMVTKTFIDDYSETKSEALCVRKEVQRKLQKGAILESIHVFDTLHYCSFWKQILNKTAFSKDFAVFQSPVTMKEVYGDDVGNNYPLYLETEYVDMKDGFYLIYDDYFVMSIDTHRCYRLIPSDEGKKWMFYNRRILERTEMKDAGPYEDELMSRLLLNITEDTTRNFESIDSLFPDGSDHTNDKM